MVSNDNNALRSSIHRSLVDSWILLHIYTDDGFSPYRSNKHCKSCLFVVFWTDMTKHEFRRFTNQYHDVVISASF